MAWHGCLELLNERGDGSLQYRSSYKRTMDTINMSAIVLFCFRCNPRGIIVRRFTIPRIKTIKAGLLSAHESHTTSCWIHQRYLIPAAKLSNTTTGVSETRLSYCILALITRWLAGRVGPALHGYLWNLWNLMMAKVGSWFLVLSF